MLLNVLSHNEKALVEQQRRRLGRDPIERLLPLSHRPLSSCFYPPSLRQNPRVERGNAFFVPRTVVVRGDPYDGWDTPPLRIDVPFSFSSGETRFHTFSRTRRWGVPLSDKERLLAQIGDMTPLFDSDRERIREGPERNVHTLLRHIARAEHHAFCFVIQGTTLLSLDSRNEERTLSLSVVITLESHHLIQDKVQYDDDDAYAPIYRFRIDGLGRALVLLDGQVIDDGGILSQELEQVSVTSNDFVFEIKTFDFRSEIWVASDFHIHATLSRIQFQSRLEQNEMDHLEFRPFSRRFLILESRDETTSPYDVYDPKFVTPIHRETFDAEEFDAEESDFWLSN